MATKFLGEQGLAHLVELMKANFAAQEHEHRDLDASIRVLNGPAETEGSVDYKIAQAISHGSSSAGGANVMEIELEDNYKYVEDESYQLDNSIWESNFDFTNPPEIVKVTFRGQYDFQTTYFIHQESRSLEGWFEIYYAITFEGDQWLLLFGKQAYDSDNLKMAFMQLLPKENVIDDEYASNDKTYSSNKIDQLIYNSEHKVRPLYVTDESAGGKTYKIVVREGVLLYESLQPDEEPVYD